MNNNEQTTSLRPSRVFTWRLYLLLFILVIVIVSIIISVSGIPQWLHTHPQYNGKVIIAEVDPLPYPRENSISASIPKLSLSAKVKIKSEIVPHPNYSVYGDNIGNVYVVVEVRDYKSFRPEICKIYKVEGDNLKIVQNLPRELWCQGPPNDSLVTDFMGNWLVIGMGNEGDVYKIEGTTALYIPQFATMHGPKFFYDTKNGGSLYEKDAFGGKYYKVTFTP